MERKAEIRYSEAFKLQVIRELEAGKHSSCFAASDAYGIKGTTTVQRWVRQYGREHLLRRVIRVETVDEVSELKALAEAIAPCVLWIDEIEKGFSHNGAASDGGTSARVFGSFLSWMQEKQKPVFIVATANDVTALPPEFLRKGRWDELFAIDLPNPQELEAIWSIQIRRHGRNPSDYDTVALAATSNGFTGAEVEAAFTAALFEAFEKDREPTMKDIKAALSETVPLSQLMPEQIQSLRKWAKGRARPATLAATRTEQRRITA